MDTTQELTDDLLSSDWNEEKHSLEFSDIVLYLFDAVLLIYTGWRSYDLISGTVPTGWEIMGFAGLLALDIGAVLWTYLWMKNASNRWQNNIAMTFFWLDMAGVALTSITDTLLYGDSEGVIYALLEPVVMLLIPIIIILNVIAGIIYHQVSDHTKHERAERALKAKSRREAQAQREEEMKLDFAQEKLLRRKKDLRRKVLLAELKVEMDRIEKATMEALNGTAKVEREAFEDESEEVSVNKLQALMSEMKDMGKGLFDKGGGTDALLSDDLLSKVKEEENEERARAHEASIQRALEDAKRQYPDADPAQIEQALRGKVTLPNGVVTNPHMHMPKMKASDTRRWMFFLTNSPKHVLRVDRNGENIQIIKGVPPKLVFDGRPSFYFDPAPHATQPKDKFRNALIPRYDAEDNLTSSHFFVDTDGNKIPLQVADWQNVAMTKVDVDIWNAPYAETTPDGEEKTDPTQAGRFNT